MSAPPRSASPRPLPALGALRLLAATPVVAAASPAVTASEVGAAERARAMPESPGNLGPRSWGVSREAIEGGSGEGTGPRSLALGRVNQGRSSRAWRVSGRVEEA